MPTSRSTVARSWNLEGSSLRPQALRRITASGSWHAPPVAFLTPRSSAAGFGPGGAGAPIVTCELEPEAAPHPAVLGLELVPSGPDRTIRAWPAPHSQFGTAPLVRERHQPIVEARIRGLAVGGRVRPIRRPERHHAAPPGPFVRRPPEVLPHGVRGRSLKNPPPVALGSTGRQSVIRRVLRAPSKCKVARYVGLQSHATRRRRPPRQGVPRSTSHGCRFGPGDLATPGRLRGARVVRSLTSRHMPFTGRSRSSSRRTTVSSLSSFPLSNAAGPGEYCVLPPARPTSWPRSVRRVPL